MCTWRLILIILDCIYSHSPSYRIALLIHTPRLFIVRKTLRAILFYILKDAIYAYTASSPHGSWADSAHLKPVVGFLSFSFWHRFWFAWVHIVLTYVSMEFYNCAYGIVSVGTGLANPRDCPSAFGNLKDLWSVRNAWS